LRSDHATALKNVVHVLAELLQQPRSNQPGAEILAL
jgi:hypothetical protein